MSQTILEMIIRTSKQGAGEKEASAALKEFKGGIGQVVEGLTGMNLTSLSVAGAVVAVGNEVKKDVEETLQYADTIREMSRASGESAEETSRLYQALDDMGLKTEDIDTLIRGAAIKGYSLTN